MAPSQCSPGSVDHVADGLAELHDDGLLRLVDHVHRTRDDQRDDREAMSGSKISWLLSSLAAGGGDAAVCASRRFRSGTGGTCPSCTTSTEPTRRQCLVQRFQIHSRARHLGSGSILGQHGAETRCFAVRAIDALDRIPFCFARSRDWPRPRARGMAWLACLVASLIMRSRSWRASLTSLKAGCTRAGGTTSCSSTVMMCMPLS